LVPDIRPPCSRVDGSECFEGTSRRVLFGVRTCQSPSYVDKLNSRKSEKAARGCCRNSRDSCQRSELQKLPETKLPTCNFAALLLAESLQIDFGGFGAVVRYEPVLSKSLNVVQRVHSLTVQYSLRRAVRPRDVLSPQKLVSSSRRAQNARPLCKLYTA